MVIGARNPVSRGQDQKNSPWIITAYLGLLLFSCWLALQSGIRFEINNAERFEGACFYQRDRVECGQEENLVQVLVVGDVMLGRGVDLKRPPFRFTVGKMQAADIAVANLEGALADPRSEALPLQAKSGNPPYNLTAHQGGVQVLQTSGLDLLSVANNHSLDAGRIGLEYTVQALEKVGISVVGAGSGIGSAYSPVIIKAKGVRLAFIGLNGIPYPNQTAQTAEPEGWQIADWNAELAAKSIQSAHQHADAVVLLVHWGDEYDPKGGLTQQIQAADLIDMGADVVIGSHPHTPQVTEIFVSPELPGKRGFVAYSLGNFVFDQADPRAQKGLALWFGFDDRGLVEVQAELARAGPQPIWLDSAKDLVEVERFRPAPQQLAFTCSHSSCESVMLPAKVWENTSLTTRVDLTGDGQIESVVLADKRLSIYEGTNLVYESPEEWDVLDAAAGDPNHDGRSEVVLAIQKPGLDGRTKSHPFVIGHRGGIYRLLWGGSAVHYPILEIEVADLDGDKDDELIVLEERTDGQHALTVWRFDNWFFSQIWSSKPDRLLGLRIASRENEQPVILVGRVW